MTEVRPRTQYRHDTTLNYGFGTKNSQSNNASITHILPTTDLPKLKCASNSQLPKMTGTLMTNPPVSPIPVTAARHRSNNSHFFIPYTWMLVYFPVYVKKVIGTSIGITMNR